MEIEYATSEITVEILSTEPPSSFDFQLYINTDVYNNYEPKRQPQPDIPFRLFQSSRIRPTFIRPRHSYYSQQYPRPSLHWLHPNDRSPHLLHVLKIRRFLLFILRSKQPRFLHFHPRAYLTSQLLDLR